MQIQGIVIELSTLADCIHSIKPDQDGLEKIHWESGITDDLGLNSLEIVAFILQVEDRCGVEIDLQEFDYEHLETLKAFVQYVQDHATRVKKLSPG